MAIPTVSGMTGKGTCGPLGMTSTVDGSGAHFYWNALGKVDTVFYNVCNLFKKSSY